MKLSTWMLCSGLVLAGGLPSRAQLQPTTPMHAAQGILVGEVTPHSALVQVRVTSAEQRKPGGVDGASGTVEFVLMRGDQIVARETKPAEATHDYLARAHFVELAAGEKYRCTTQIVTADGERSVGPTAEFSTLWGEEPADVRFVVVTGMNYAKFHGDERIDRETHLIQNNTELPAPYARADKHLGYPALQAIWKLRPHFFVGTGDNVYYDTPREGRAQTIDEMRQKWHEQFRQPRYRQLFADVPTYWMMDDHDFRVDDADNSGDYPPSPELGKQVFLEQLPIGPQGDEDTKTYRTHRVARDLQIWFPENRLYRSDNLTPDGPGKTIWGAAQKTWLRDTLQQSDATFKLLVSPTPMVGPDDKRKTDNHTNIGGFQHERDEFFAWLRSSGVADKNFYVICGDRHWQYHARHPSGIEEFSCGALVDANSRLGRQPGDPASTDPDATIEQRYAQTVRSGGFLEVLVQRTDAPTLKFIWHDEHGTILHETQKVAR